MADLFLDKIRNNPNAKIIIGLPKKANGGSRGAMEAFITENTSIGGTANYNDPGMEGVVGPLAEAAKLASRTWNVTTGMTNRAGSTSFAQRQLRTVHSTIATWEDHTKLEFTLRLSFYALTAGDDVTQKVKTLIKCTYPSKGAGGVTMIAPNDYDGTEENLVSLQIGQWFITPPLFLIKNANFSVSKEIVKGGLPLYAEGSVNFQAYKALFDDEWESFFTEAAKLRTGT